MPDRGERMTRLRQGQGLTCLPQVWLETGSGRGDKGPFDFCGKTKTLLNQE